MMIPDLDIYRAAKVLGPRHSATRAFVVRG